MRSQILTTTIALTAAFTLLGLTPGQDAPDFQAKNQRGQTVKLSALRGKSVLLYFYPKDDTPDCTREACSIRDHFDQFRKLGAVVYGVSKQGEQSHQAFRAKHKLPFDLLVDEDGQLAKSYGIGEIPDFGMLKRESVLIDPRGKIAKIYPDVNPDTHSAEVLRDLAALQNH